MLSDEGLARPHLVELEECTSSYKGLCGGDVTRGKRPEELAGLGLL